MKREDEMEAARDAVQVCMDCAEIAAAIAAATPDTLASPSAWDALDEYEKTVKDGPAYGLANVGGTSRAVWRIMHAPTPPGEGAERLEQALWLEGLWYSLHPDARPKKTGGTPKKRPAIYSIIEKEPRLYFASVDYFFGPALSSARGGGAGHLGKSFRFMGRALAAQAGIDWPDKTSPLAARVVSAFERAASGEDAEAARARAEAERDTWRMMAEDKIDRATGAAESAERAAREEGARTRDAVEAAEKKLAGQKRGLSSDAARLEAFKRFDAAKKDEVGTQAEIAAGVLDDMKEEGKDLHLDTRTFLNRWRDWTQMNRPGTVEEYRAAKDAAKKAKQPKTAKAKEKRGAGRRGV